jgi:hypothetical protein
MTMLPRVLVPRAGDGTPLTTTAPRHLGIEPFVRSDNGTEQMAVNGSSSWAEDVWDGDTTAWTRGGVGSKTTGSKHSGTYGLDTGVVAKNSVWWFDYGSDRDLEASFDSVSFWMNVRAYPEGSNLRCGWAVTGTTTILGSPANIPNYVSSMDPGWQRVTIPLADFGLPSNVGRFVCQTRLQASQQYWIDDVDMLNSTGDGPYKFRVLGVEGKEYDLSRVTLSIAAPETGWNSDAFANIASGLEQGLIVRMANLSTQEIVWSIVIKNNIELFTKLVPSTPYNFADGEQMVVFNVRPDKASVILDEDHGIEWVVRDDLSTINNIRASCQYGVEIIPRAFEKRSDEVVTAVDGHSVVVV